MLLKSFFESMLQHSYYYKIISSYSYIFLQNVQCLKLLKFIKQITTEKKNVFIAYNFKIY